MTQVAGIADLREQARKRLPRVIFEYLEGGSYDEVTLRRNREQLERLRLRQRVMTDVSDRRLATTLVGEAAVMPLALAPAGLTGLLYPNGEVHAARAAEAFGVPYCLTTMSINSIEDVAEAVSRPFWFQLYLMRDRGINEALIERAKGPCSTLVLTLDLHVQGTRRRDVRNGLSVPPKLTLRNVVDMLTSPRWALGMAASRRRTFGNLEGLVENADDALELSDWVEQQFDPSFGVKDVEWVRGLWPGKLVLKGILDPRDAELAARVGADAVVVSNHGGRQLDGAPSPVAVLGEIREAAGEGLEVFADSGIRSGLDILKFLALGARAGLAGRAYLYGLAADGEAGVTKALELIRDELDDAMAMTGVTDVGAIPRDVVIDPATPG